MTWVRWAACASLLAAAGCDDTTIGPNPVQGIDPQVRAQLTRWGVVPILPMPAQNPALVDLGQALFFDKVLSGNRDIACATCHDPLSHGTDGLSLAIGTGGTGSGAARTLGPGRQFVPRNAPTMLNQGLRPFYLFWDGRVSGFGAGPFSVPPGVVLPGGLPTILAAQAMFPVLNRREMRGDSGDVDALGQPNELASFADSQYADVWRAIMTSSLVSMTRVPSENSVRGDLHGLRAVVNPLPLKYHPPLRSQRNIGEGEGSLRFLNCIPAA